MKSTNCKKIFQPKSSHYAIIIFCIKIAIFLDKFAKIISTKW
jgi:hypothetical protein